VKEMPGADRTGRPQSGFLFQPQAGRSADSRQANHRLEGKALARLARTRRSVRSSRRRPRASGVQGIQHGFVQKGLWIKNCAFVRHTTSPLLPRLTTASRHSNCQIRSATTELNSYSRYAIQLRPLILSRSRASAFDAVGGPLRLSLLFEAIETHASCLRNFDTKLRHPYCYEFEPDNRLESVANAHTAADLHVRPDP
jgi:hypothetical protein